MNISSRAAFAGLCLAIAGTAAATDPVIKVNGFYNGYGQNVNISLNGSSSTVGAGAFDTQLNGGTTFTAYCADLQHTTSFGSSWGVNVLDTTSGGSGLDNGSLVAKLVNTFSAGVNSADKGTALQLAIWSAIYNGSVTTSGSHFGFSGVSSSIQSEFNTIAGSSLSGASSHANYYSAISHGAGNNINQNMVSAAPVPEPASMVACAIGLVGLVRRRKKA